MSALSFLNSPLLWGLALAAVPILIHLLYRRQYRRIEWAPMRYLKMSVQRNRRRLQIEQLLLLLLRTLAVLLLFFFLAKPIMHAEGLSRLFGASSRVNRIVVVDDSLSMGYQEQSKTALSRGVGVLAELLPTFGSKDHLTLVLASKPQSPLLREVELENIDETLELVRQIRETDVFVAWPTVFKEIDTLIASGSYPLHEVTLVTDLRAAGWDAPLSDLGSRWAESGVLVRLFDVGLPSVGNVSAVRLEQVDHLALTGVPTRFEVHIKNDTDGELGGLEGNFIVDGKPTLVRVPTIARGDSLRLPLIATFQDAGTHKVAFELPRDALPGDNTSWLVVHASTNIDILLVDGEPASEPFGGETDYLALVLSLAGASAETYHVEMMTDSQWASSTPTRPDLMVLANVASLTTAQADALERLVDGGMGLMIFLGDQIDPDNFNQLLFKSGVGLSPAALESAEETEFSGLLVETVDGSPLDSLSQLKPAALQRIAMRKMYLARLARDTQGVRVLARWNNADATPAVIQKVFGQGQVLLWTTTADRAWSDWPTEPSFVLAMREASRAIARSGASQRQLVAGQEMRIELPARRDITDPLVDLPAQSEPKPLVISTSPSSDPAQPERWLVYGDTRKAGFYTFTWRDSVAGGMQETWAFNPDRRESNLARLDDGELKSLFGALNVDVIHMAHSESATLAVHGKEIWRTLAMSLLGLLLVESCFARWAGRQR